MKIILKNRTRTDCGIVAAFNAASWCNIDLDYDQVLKASKSCGYNEKKGIYRFQFEHLLKKLKIPAKRIKPKDMEEMQTKLYMGKFFIFFYTPIKDRTGHVIVSFMDHKGRIRIFNPDRHRMTWDEFASDVNANGMRNFIVYELPHRKLVKQHDVRRST